MRPHFPLLVLLSAFALPPAQATTYYVATNGSDTNPGTEAAPWATLSHAADQLQAGDKALVHAGTYAEHVTLYNSGTAGNPIRFEAVGQATVEGFQLAGDHQQVVGFRIRTLDCDGQDGYGIEALGDQFLIQGNDIYEMPDGGIRTGPLSTAGIIQDNRLERNVQSGIELHGQDHLVAANEIMHPLERHPVWACRGGTDDANGITFFGRGHLIIGNHIYDVTYDDPNVLDAHIDCIQTYGSWIGGEINDDVIVEDNVCEALSYQNEDENGNALYVEAISNLVVRNNLFLSYRGLGADADVTNLEVVNNTFVSAMDLGGNADEHVGVDLWHPSVGGGMIRNNIFVDFRGGPYYLGNGVDTVANDHNLMYWTDGLDRTQGWWEFQCGEAGNLCADPLLADPFAGDFRPAADSPVVDAGSATVPVTDDFEGTARPQGAAYDLGAFELPAGPSAPTAAFRAAQRFGCSPLLVQFSDHSTGQPTSWFWEFGDGSTSNVPSPEHQYTAAGFYDVTLTVTNAQGSDQLTRVNYVRVFTGPVTQPWHR